MRIAACFIAVLLAVSACSKPKPPVGKWEGGYEGGGDLVVARVEILPSGQVKVMAPDITNLMGAQIAEYRARLAADLANGWSSVEPRDFDFDGKTFRKPGGVAPQLEWDATRKRMTMIYYSGNRSSVRVTLTSVGEFGASKS